MSIRHSGGATSVRRAARAATSSREADGRGGTDDLEVGPVDKKRTNAVARAAERMIALPRSVQLGIACSGIFFSFSYFAVLQEDVYKKPYGGEYFKYTFLALVAERGVNALIGVIGVCALGSSGLTIPHRDIFVSGVSQMFAMAGSNEALRYVSYPTQVLGKSCKMVPVMAGGLVIGGKSYSMFEYFQVALITIGVCVFNLVRARARRASFRWSSELRTPMPTPVCAWAHSPTPTPHRCERRARVACASADGQEEEDGRRGLAARPCLDRLLTDHGRRDRRAAG